MDEEGLQYCTEIICYKFVFITRFHVYYSFTMRLSPVSMRLPSVSMRFHTFLCFQPFTTRLPF